MSDLEIYLRKLLLTLLVIGLVMIAYFGAEVIFLLFAGILVSVFLQGLASALSSQTKLSYRFSLAIVVALIVALSVLTFFLFLPSFGRQYEQLLQALPEALENLKQRFEKFEIGRQFLSSREKMESLVGEQKDILKRATGFLSSTLGLLSGLVIIPLTGLYFAIEPETYRHGLVKLFPKSRQQRLLEVYESVEQVLRWWLLGKFVGMAAIGSITTLGLWLLDIPLAVALGLMAALFTFIPNFGPVLAAVPAVLLALVHGEKTAGYVILLYLGAQFLESNFITPLIERKTIKIPPALSVSFQIMLGIFIGVTGVALAVPLLATIMVLVKKLYIEDVLKQES